MKHTRVVLFALLIFAVLNGCSKHTNGQHIVNTKHGKFIIDKQKNILHIKRTFELYKKYKSYKAMAIAMDRDGRYVIGYSKDSKSSFDAKAIALENCEKANSHAQLKVTSPCTLYAVENVILNPLQ